MILGNKMSDKTNSGRTAVSTDQLPQFMNESAQSAATIEEKASWLNNNLHKLMIGISVVWFAVVLIYITQFFGWSNLFLMMPDEFGGFLAGITLPLAIVWVVMAYIDRGTSFRQEAKFLRAYLNQLVYPDEGAPQTVKAMADAIRSQTVELQEASKVAAGQAAKIKDEMKENIKEFGKLIAVLDNYSSKTVVELSDGIKLLSRNFETITDKAQSSAEKFLGLNREFSSGATDIEQSMENLFEKLLPRLKEVKSSTELLHQMTDASNRDIAQASELLRRYGEETGANLDKMSGLLNAHSENLKQISEAAINNCGLLKKNVTAEIDAMSAKLDEHSGRLENAISQGNSLMRDKIKELSAHACEQLNLINQTIGKGLSQLDSSVFGQIKLVDSAVAKNKSEIAELMKALDKQTVDISKKISAHGEVLAQELDKILVRSHNLEDGIGIQINNLDNISEQTLKSMQKASAAIEESADSLKNSADSAAEGLERYIDVINAKSNELKIISGAVSEDFKQAGDTLQDRHQQMVDLLDETAGRLKAVGESFETSNAQIRQQSDEAVAAINVAADTMNRYAGNLNEAASVVKAQNQVSETSLAQQYKNITDSVNRISDIKAELNQQLQELSSASGVLENNARTAVATMKGNISAMLDSCNEVINKSRAINDNLAEQSVEFDTSTNKTLAKVAQFDNVLNTQNQSMDRLSRMLSERVAEIENILKRQNKELNDASAASLDNFRQITEDFAAQNSELNQISRGTTEYVATVLSGLEEKAAALNTLFKQQENEFYDFCGKIADNAENMSDALRKQVGIIEQSADKVFSRMVVLEEDTSRHTEAVVANSHRSIDRLTEIESMIESKNANIRKLVEEVTDNFGLISQTVQGHLTAFGGSLKKIDEQGRDSAKSLLDTCTVLQAAENSLGKTGSSVCELLDNHAKNLDLAVSRAQNQTADIQKILASQVESLIEASNSLSTQSRLGEASLAQQYKYLSEAVVMAAQKMKEINDGFKNNTNDIFETSTRLAYEFNVLGDRLIKTGEEIDKTSKLSLKNMEQVSLSLSQNNEDLDAAIQHSVEKIGGVFSEYEKYIAGFNTITAETSTGVIEINNLISAQSDKMVKISDDTKKLVDCFNTVLNDTSNQLSERAGQAYDKVKGLGKDLKALGLQMEEAAKVSAAHMLNSGDKLRASVAEAAANAERISNDILNSGDVFIKQSAALVSATDDTVAKVNKTLGNLLELSKDFDVSGDKFAKDTIHFSDILSSRIKELNEQTSKTDKAVKALNATYQGIEIEGFLKQAGTIIEKLQSLSVDINRVFNPKDEEDLWKRFYNGDTAVFVRYLAKNITKTQVAAVRKAFEQNADFRTQVNAYLSEFELLINAAKKREHSGLLLSIVSGADIGKLYYVLAKIMDRLEG